MGEPNRLMKNDLPLYFDTLSMSGRPLGLDLCARRNGLVVVAAAVLLRLVEKLDFALE